MTLSTEEDTILIAGVGNVLLQDDGVGVHAVRAMQDDAPDNVVAMEIGTGVLAALDLIESADRILVIDAMRAGGPAGAIYASVLTKASARGPQTWLFRPLKNSHNGDTAGSGAFGSRNGNFLRNPLSVHQLCLMDALRHLEPDSVAPEIVVLGMEPEGFDYGQELSHPVRAALPGLIEAARGVAAAWRQGRCPSLDWADEEIGLASHHDTSQERAHWQ